MHHHVAVIHDHPAVAREALFFAFLAMFFADILQYRVGEGVEHTVAGAGAEDKVIGKGNHIFDVKQDDILPLFILKGVDDFTCQFECVQNSPQV